MDEQKAKSSWKAGSALTCFPCSLFQLDDIVQQCRFWTGQPMMDIFRPTQPLDGRVVYCSQASAALKLELQLWVTVLPVVLGTLLH